MNGGRRYYYRVELDERRAAQLGFPADPQPGQLVRDARGIIWRYPDDASHGGDGLGEFADLGQWQAFIPLATSLIGGIFGGNAAKKQAEAIKAQAAAQVEIEQLRLQQAQANRIPWNLIIIAGAAVLLLK